MKPWFRAAALIAVVAPLTACSFYFGDDTGDDCKGPITADEAYPSPGYRNPDTGSCEVWGGGCGDDREPGAQAFPDWAVCDGVCESLDEISCIAAAECRAAYTGQICPPGADCPPYENQFLGCWGIAPSGPAEGESCWGLDAYACSRHNDCSAVYSETAYPFEAAGDALGPAYAYVGCEPEVAQGCYTDEECPSGYECTADTECSPPPGCGFGESDCDAPEPTCYGTCVPSTNACAAVDCEEGYHCEERCYPCDEAGGECPPACEVACVPDYNTCDAIDCGTGYECQELCHPCDPLPDGTGCDDGPRCEPVCVPIVDPTCEGVDCGEDAHCELQCYPGPDPDPTDPPSMDECYPVCVPDYPTTCAAVDCGPGYHCEDICATWECTPDGECPPPTCGPSCVPDEPTETCESLASEDACAARLDCVAVYTGENCECYPWFCTCETLTYERCETGWIVDPADGTRTARRRVLASTLSP